MEKYRLGTDCLHAGYRAENAGPQVLPITQATTFRYYSAEDVAHWFDLDADTFAYSRLANPTVSALAERMTALEGGSAGVCTSSGQAANLCTVLNLCQAGDHVLAAVNIYGGTYNLFHVTLRRMGIETTFFHPQQSEEEILALARPNTKLLFGETLGNPALNVLDFEKCSRIAKALKVPLAVDNTLATPVFCRPLEHGADIVTHSTTKYADGQGQAVGGCIVESGRFDWAAEGKYPLMAAADESYHGLNFYEKFGAAALSTRTVACLLRDLGCTMAPMNAWLTFQGLQTLEVRMKKHAANALAVARFLQGHPKVAMVKYPGLEEDGDYALAQRYMPEGQSGVLSFILEGGREAGEKVQEAVELISVAVHVGDAKSCMLHPASTTHRQMSAQEQTDAGIDPGLIRLSVGIEDPADIIADLEQALEKIGR